MTDTNLARALDLTRAVTDILNKSGAIGGLVGQVVKWLAREGIPEGEFAHCLEKSKALIYPNDNGLKIRSRLEESDAKSKAKPYIAGLKLVSAMSIGKWMTYDPDYCYLVTTVAALFAHHDMPYTSEVICDMLLDKCTHEKGSSQVYRYEKSRILPVVRKIVESITLNVVNASGNFDNLPEEIRGTCSHHIDSHILAAAAMAISRTSGNVIIRCNRFLADLYVWLLAHIEGDMSLSIAGKIVHRATFGRPSRSVTMLADEACLEGHDEITSTLVISTNVGGTLRTMLRHTADHAKHGGSCVNIRQPLYDLVGYNRAGQIHRALTRQESREIRFAGQRIVAWLMARPAIADHSSRIVYSTRLTDDDFVHSGLAVDSLLSRWPAICNEDLGPRVRTSKHSFKISNKLERKIPCEAEEISIRDMLSCFPHARAIILQACTRCQCKSCRTVASEIGKFSLAPKSGCLAYLAEDHLCLIIAHAVADGFGIPDASNLGDFSDVRKGVQRLMSELISRKRIAWETWFSLANLTYLGCAWPEEIVKAGEGSDELAAVQHGSEVVVAPWVDLRSDLKLENSFSCLIAAGRLCEMEADFGVLYAEEASPPAGTTSDWNVPDIHSIAANVAEISLQWAIAVESGPLFRLMIIVEACNYLRIINPATIFMALDRSWVPKCNDFYHGAPAQNHQMWSIEDALGLLGKGESFTDSTDPWIMVDAVTHCITQQRPAVRLNVLMALSPRGCVVKQDDCCVTCAIAQGRDRVQDLHARRIIQVAGTTQFTQGFMRFSWMQLTSLPLSTNVPHMSAPLEAQGTRSC